MDSTRKKTLQSAAAEKNFITAVHLWGGLSSSRMKEENGVLFVSTGVAIPDQNYVLTADLTDVPQAARQAFRFFRSEAVPFTWWIPPSAHNAAIEDAIDQEGLPARCSPPAMFLDLSGERKKLPLPPDVDIRKVENSREANIWAQCSLKGFESGEEHQKAMAAFASAMAEGPSRRSFQLLTLFSKGSPAASAQLVFTDTTAGLYYFSVSPTFRRKGLGKILLEKTLEEALRAGCHTVTLQASPMGFPLYRNAGFRECGRFHVHSSYPDAC